MAKIALTGIKPTGTPHLGNLLGAIKPALELTKDYLAFYFIADYHALTSVKDKKLLHEQIYKVAATWLAAGLDPEKVVFYRQSDIPEIFELNWILSCFTPKGLLNRAHAYKACVDKNLEFENDPDMGINCGLFNYPVLMAADILMFNSNVVPVGQDQKQHLEMARDMAHTFNQNYKKIFTLPEPLIQENVKTIPGIDGRKMSKSYHNEIPLFATPKEVRKKVMQIVSDSKGVEEAKDPDSCNIFAIYQHFSTPEQIEDLRGRYLAGGLGYGTAKQELFERLEDSFAEGREKYNYYMAHKEEVDRILREGAVKARKIATPLLAKIRNSIGI
ncbi:MAG: tryptophan--tRNA ligase [SAR324 cluster bacterium]|uniref:Tryptophan--tRNA ligase n=1 Tax=SAR324 cluster bacterium TaxID=2024889 RepID=A0A2A4SVA2_9DELT|nr:MAG: tryptophan--tRNA ligase [SAR324 cluster bacterium]